MIYPSQKNKGENKDVQQVSVSRDGQLKQRKKTVNSLSYLALSLLFGV